MSIFASYSHQHRKSSKSYCLFWALHRQTCTLLYKVYTDARTHWTEDNGGRRRKKTPTTTKQYPLNTKFLLFIFCALAVGGGGVVVDICWMAFFLYEYTQTILLYIHIMVFFPTLFQFRAMMSKTPDLRIAPHIILVTPIDLILILHCLCVRKMLGVGAYCEACQSNIIRQIYSAHGLKTNNPFFIRIRNTLVPIAVIVSIKTDEK